LRVPLYERFALIIAPFSEATEIWNDLVRDSKPAGLSYWEYLMICAGLAEVRPQTQGEFIPQMLNFQHTGAVNFRKGCYTGQEIVARMQYLGKLKRRMYRLAVNHTSLISPGTSIDLAEKKDVGTTVMAQWSSPGQQQLLAVLTEEAASSNQLAFDDAQIVIERLPLPYEEKFAENPAARG